MFKSNNLLLGVIYGLIPPVLAWLIFAVWLKNEALIMNKPAAPYLISIGINLVILRFCARAYLDKTSRGIVIATFACTILVAVLKIYGR